MSRIVLAAVLFALPVFAQTTTTVKTEQQPNPQPPPPPGTTVNVNPNEPPPGTTVNVNPNQPGTRTRVRVNDEAAPAVETMPTGRSAAAIIATDAMYGGVAGVLIGGGVTLIDQGNHWERDLMLGAGIGILAGAAVGVVEAATQPPRVITHAAADRDPARSAYGTQLVAAGGRF
jgi:hypothetical protein